MTKIDQFESAFKAATKPVYNYAPIDIRKVVVVTDLSDDGALELTNSVRGFLGVLEETGTTDWLSLADGDFSGIEDLLNVLERQKPDLVCTYRHLQSGAWQWTHSLGEALDVLTQQSPYPILVVPHPSSGRALEHALENTDTVMAITDHLSGDDHLVNFAAGLVQRDGTLYLTHIEDEKTFARYTEIISKIPQIDTDTATEEIRKRLLDEPKDYIRSCREILEQRGVQLRIEEIVTMGHRLSDYRQLVESNRVDLLVSNTKDDDQDAMHGMTYPLAVELRQIPLLML